MKSRNIILAAALSFGLLGSPQASEETFPAVVLEGGVFCESLGGISLYINAKKDNDIALMRYVLDNRFCLRLLRELEVDAGEFLSYRGRIIVKVYSHANGRVYESYTDMNDLRMVHK